MAKLVMALDQGTTSSRTIIFDEQGQIVAKAQEAFDCLYPKPGWVEQNPYDLWHTQQKTMKDALAKAKLTMADITCIGITNQRETTIAWNKETGEALGKAIVWQCRRTADYCDTLKAEGFDKIISERTGLVTDAYFSGTKMRWFLKNNPEAKALADEGKLAFGTVDSWLIWNLTGHKVHKMDASNASRTMVYDIHKNCWDEEILAHFEIPLNTLPEVCPSSGIVGETDPSLFNGTAPISGIAGDQQAALFGQACFKRGMAKNTYGTGCFLLMNTGEETIKSNNGLLTTIAWQKDGKTTYALEGAVFIGGALMQWLRDGLELFEDAAETEQMATMIPSADGVYVVPAFVGLGAPHWDPYARGTIVGLTRDTTKNHIVRASLKAIAFQCYDVLKAMETDLGETLATLRIDGGASMNSFLCQFQADILGCKVTRPSCVETTAMGAAFLAGLATGVWESEEEIAKLWDIDTIFEAQRPAKKVDDEIETWHRAVERSKGWIIER